MRRRLSRLFESHPSGERLSRELRSVVEPIEELLLPRHFSRAGTLDLGGVVVGCRWVSEQVFVSVGFEPRESWGSAAIGRRLPDVPVMLRSLRDAVELDPLLRSRGMTPSAPVSRNWSGSSPAAIRQWAYAIAGDLLKLEDLLEGQNLDTIDRLLEASAKATKGAAVG